MIYFIGLIVSLLSPGLLTKAQSSLLESVKNNPSEAQALCSKFRKLNSQGISASSTQSISSISSQRNLSEIDAEILSMYVRGIHCPDVT